MKFDQYEKDGMKQNRTSLVAREIGLDIAVEKGPSDEDPFQKGITMGQFYYFLREGIIKVKDIVYIFSAYINKAAPEIKGGQDYER